MSKFCLGCGILLQDVDENMDGYVSYSENDLCMRCFRLRNYGENRKINRDNKDFLNIIDNISGNDLVIYVSSLLTLNLDFIYKFKNVILVLTKRDIIPKSVRDEKIINYVTSRYNIDDLVIVSSYKKYNLDRLYNLISLRANNRDIYFVGSTNSGKSSLINALINSYGDKNSSITTSYYPSTTLSIVNVQLGNLCIKDTPGLIVSNSIINYLNNKDIKMINSSKEIKPITFQVTGRGSILVGDLFRIVYDCCGRSSLTFYMSNNLNIRNCSLNNNIMLDCNYIEYDVKDNSDIVFDDLGFIKITNGIKIIIYSKYIINVRIRDNMI